MKCRTLIVVMNLAACLAATKGVHAQARVDSNGRVYQYRQTTNGRRWVKNNNETYALLRSHARNQQQRFNASHSNWSENQDHRASSIYGVIGALATQRKVKTGHYSSRQAAMQHIRQQFPVHQIRTYARRPIQSGLSHQLGGTIGGQIQHRPQTTSRKQVRLIPSR